MLVPTPGLLLRAAGPATPAAARPAAASPAASPTRPWSTPPTSRRPSTCSADPASTSGLMPSTGEDETPLAERTTSNNCSTVPGHKIRSKEQERLHYHPAWHAMYHLGRPINNMFIPATVPSSSTAMATRRPPLPLTPPPPPSPPAATHPTRSTPSGSAR